MKRTRFAILFSVVVALSGALTPSPLHASDKTNPVGMNVAPWTEYDLSKPLVDVIKLSRAWETPSGNKARADVHGWPLEDAQTLVWTDIAGMNGTYKLSFAGSAEVYVDWTTGYVTHQSYNGVTNTTTAEIVTDSADKSNMILGFRRTDGGVKNVKLIRPGYSGTETFTTPYKDALSKASVIRLLDISNSDNSHEVNWSDRKLPSYFSQATMADDRAQSGGAWEYAIQLCNEVKRDAWVSVPTGASDDYVVKLAQLWKDGDTVDGVTYPGLDPSLNIYVEFSNEVWNPTFDSWRLNHAQAMAEVRAGNSPLSYDGATDDTLWAWRRTGKRIKEMSDDFRSVFGDGAMGTRIRPVLAAQLGTPDVGKQALTFIDNVYGNQHPLNYYLYGFGGSAYYSPDNDSNSLTLDSLFGGLLTNSWIKSVQDDTDWAAAYGLKHVAYEGGPSLDTTGHSDTVKSSAVTDPRMTTAMVRQHEAWTANGGDLLVYYVMAWDYQWGFTDNINNLDTPKYRALDQLASSATAPLGYGTPLPANLNAGRWSISSSSGSASDSPITLRPLAIGPGFDPEQAYWTAYTVRSESAGQYQLSVSYFADQAGDLQLSVDGAPLATVSLASTGGADQTSASVVVSLGTGLHSIRLQSLRGQFNVRSLQVEAAAPPTPTPNATPTASPDPTSTPTPVPVPGDEPTPMPSDDDAQ